MGDADTPQGGRCSLAVAQDRKSLFGQIAADGVPKPLTIHVLSSKAERREIRNGQSVFLVASTRDADPSRDFELAISRTESRTPPPSPAAIWRIESVQAQTAAVAEEELPLVDRAVFELRDVNGSGYLQLSTPSMTVPRGEASRFVLYKADVPDPTRPTTCDAQIRDEDFVFMRAIAPSAWVSVATTGALEIPRVAAGSKTPPASDKNPNCAREEERCHTDPRGGLVCTWAPVCGD